MHFLASETILDLHVGYFLSKEIPVNHIENVWSVFKINHHVMVSSYRSEPTVIMVEEAGSLRV